MSSHLKAELAATCSTLGRLHKGEYLIEPECIESVKDLIRYLKRDNEMHEIRRYLGESKVLQNDLIHIVKSCPEENPDLFDVTVRLLINLTTPTMLFYGEEIPTEKISRNVYLSLVSHSQEYKIAFCDVEFWNKICGKLTNLFETDWSERSADDGIQIERILMLLRNVLQVPADEESEKRPDNDASVHDKVLWALRQSQILELLLFITSNKDEEQYYLNLLEIFSLILREQNPKLLARCDVERSAEEKNEDTENLIRVRESEKKSRNKYLNMRNFNATFVMKGVKSLSNKDVVCHKSLDKVNNWDLNGSSKKQAKARRNRIPVESERTVRRSSFSVRLFLREFSMEFLNCSFGRVMNVVKNKLDSGRSLANDQTYYFWALKFFLDFAVASDSNVELIKDFLSSETFHFVQTNMENAFEHLQAEKKKTVDWVKRIHLILKAYHSLLEVLLWMDSSKNPLTRSVSREIKSQIFYVVEYREMTLHLLFRYDPAKFSTSYLRDLIETTHLFIKLLEEYSKQTKLVVQRVKKKKKTTKRKKKKEPEKETREEKWEKIKDDVYDVLCSESCFPEIPPFDAALDIPVDEQKGRAMKKIQGLLLDGKIRDAIGFLRSARQVWPENDHFGAEGMAVEEETMALQEICLADLGEVEGDIREEGGEEEEESEEDPEDGKNRMEITEQDFDIMDYKKRLVNKKVVEGCGILLSNYKKNSVHTNHCVIKLLHRIGWECCMPAMLFQASLFWTLLKAMRETGENYKEIQTFAVNLVRKFRKHAVKNPVVFLELLFWKEHNVALEIQHGYEPYESKPKRKTKAGFESGEEEGAVPKRRGRKKKNVELGNENQTKKRRQKKRTQEVVEFDRSPDNDDENEDEIVTKSVSDVSRMLFDNSESSDEETSTNDRRSGRTDGINDEEEKDNGVDEDGQKGILRNDAKLREDSDEEEKDSRVDEGLRNNDETKLREESDEEGKDNRVDEEGRKETMFKNNYNANLKEDSDEEEKNNQVNEGRRKKTNRSRILSESSEEDEANPSEKLTENKEEEIGGKDSDDNSINISQKSNTSSGKKRKAESSDSDLENVNSKSKRVRYIGSDSEMEDDKPEGLKTKKKKRRRRLKAVIDSDSDVDVSWRDEK